jgi:PTH1 family peptidyl-tRNA hydrolase
MHLIAGLGNPGEQYENTPHNSGFLFLDMFKVLLKDSTDLQIGEWSEDKMFQSSFVKIEKDGELLAVFQKPMTFMNRSGAAVAGAIKRFNLADYQNELILVHDDLDLKLGTFKIQKEKSPKAHNGVLDVESSLKGKDFLRVRIGVDARTDRTIPGERYVLIPFEDEQHELLKRSVLSAINGLREVIKI